uniref:Uncharacterized protein n=1 Tax=Melopsittacus undulatus TaxID=13146 RepID=A0A8V5FI53_MELUD
EAEYPTLDPACPVQHKRFCDSMILLFHDLNLFARLVIVYIVLTFSFLMGFVFVGGFFIHLEKTQVQQVPVWSLHCCTWLCCSVIHTVLVRQRNVLI